MIKKVQIIICSLVIIVLVGGILSTQVVAVLNQCSSVEQIYRNMDLCDRQNVTLTGKVTNLEFRISERGNKYTTFMLDDATATPLKVFSYTHLSLSEGDTVKVSGTFNKVVSKQNYTFPMQIVTTPEKVFVVKPAESLLNKLLPGLIIIFVIVVIFIVYKKYKQHKTLKDTEYEKGSSFEYYIQSLFDMGDWHIVKATSDLGRKYERRVESDSDPDFVMKHKKSNKVIAVECKYRSRFDKGREEPIIYWASEYNIKKYNVFREKEKIPVFIAIGIGGAPSKPDHLFLVPLYCLKYRRVSKEYLEKFERSPKDKFTISEFKKLDKTL